MKAMKKVMMTIAVVVVLLMGISDKAQARAGPWTGRAFDLGARHRSVFGLVTSHRFGLRPVLVRPVLGRSSLTRSAFGLGRRGRNVYYGRDGKVLRYVRPGMNIVGGLHQMSVDNRVVNHQISMDNQAMDMAGRRQDRELSMAERDQRIRAQNGTVLVQRGPIILQVRKPEQMQSQESHEIQQLQQQLKALEIQVKELKQKLEKAKK